MKLKKHMVWGLVGVALITAAGNVQASLRPYGDAAQLSELQGVFDGIGATSIDAVNDQLQEMAFEPTGAGNSVASYIATVSYGAGASIQFGIYNLADPNQTVEMFNYNSATPGDVTYLQFNLDENYVRSVDANSLTVIDSASYFKQFGFYAISSYGTYFSEDYLNPSAFAHFLSYQSEGDLVTIGNGDAYNDIGHYYIAAEVGTPDGIYDQADFSDMVVQMESIIPIPEPASLVLIGITASSIAFIRRRVIA